MINVDFPEFKGPITRILSPFMASVAAVLDESLNEYGSFFVS